MLSASRISLMRKCSQSSARGPQLHDDVPAEGGCGADVLVSFGLLANESALWDEVTGSGRYEIGSEGTIDGPRVLAVLPDDDSYYRDYSDRRVYDRLLRESGELNGYPLVFDRTKPPLMLRPQIVPPHFDATLAVSWIRYCGQCHGPVCNRRSKPLQTLQLVDCDNLNIVDAPRDAKYAALSYVWKASGKSCDVDTCDGKRKLPSSLPLVIADAVKVSKLLGYRYLWIDKFCIDQENSAIKHLHIRHMDSIYEAAEVTIVAAAGDDEDFGLPGVSNRPKQPQPVAILDSICVMSSMREPRESIRRSRWWTRGWTYQEGVLSRRRLVFTEEQVYFECNAMNCYESVATIGSEIYFGTLGKKRDSLSPGIFGRNQRLKFAGFDPSGLSMHELFLQYLESVEQFSARNLTFDNDSLNAFRGIMKRYSRTGIPTHEVWRRSHGTEPTSQARHDLRGSTPICHLWGVPVTITGHLRKDTSRFASGLAWYHVHSCWDAGHAPRRRCNFPSWSWAGWAGQVVYPDKGFHNVSAFEARLDVVSPTFAELGAKISGCGEPSFESDEHETKELVVDAVAFAPEDFALLDEGAETSWTLCGNRATLHLSRGAQSEAEFFDLLMHGQAIKCVLVGSLFVHSFVMVLQKDLHCGRETYSRIGMFIVDEEMYSWALSGLKARFTIV